MTRYGFSIRTRSGPRVDNVRIVAATLDNAERRLRQMYPQCEILGCRQASVRSHPDAFDVEALIELIDDRAASPREAATWQEGAVVLPFRRPPRPRHSSDRSSSNSAP